MAWRSMGANVSSPFSMTACWRQRRPCSEGCFRGLGCWKRVTFHMGAPVDIQGIPGTTNEKREALEKMKSKLEVLNPHQAFALLTDDPSHQKAWDLPIVKINWENMLRAADHVSRARLLATVQKESGAWLNALPVSSLGTLLNSGSFGVAISLRVGADVCIPHSCRRGGRMNGRGLHGLPCKYSAVRFPRHSAMNDVVKRALQKAGLPSVLEPPRVR